MLKKYHFVALCLYFFQRMMLKHSKEVIFQSFGGIIEQQF